MSLKGKESGLRKKNQITIALFLSLLYCGCGDPGYRLYPIGWDTRSDRKWTKRFTDFEIQTRGVGGLIGDWWVDPDLQIYNNTKSISVESAELRTPTEKFSAEIYSSNAIPPSTSGYHIPVEWKFAQNRPAREVLGDRCEIVLNLKVGGESRRIEIQYEK